MGGCSGCSVKEPPYFENISSYHMLIAKLFASHCVEDQLSHNNRDLCEFKLLQKIVFFSGVKFVHMLGVKAVYEHGTGRVML